MEHAEAIKLIDQFINENGLWADFKDFVENQGYTVKELGFNDED